MKLYSGILLLTFATITLKAQELRFEAPKKLTEGVNTSSEESYPLLSPDKSTLYFVRTLHKKNTGGRYAGQDVWKSLKESNDFDQAENDFPLFNNEGNNAILGFSEDGNKIYLLNSYSGKNSLTPGISVSQRAGEEWSAPVDMDIPEITTEESFYSAYIGAPEDVIVVSKKGEDSYGLEDLFVTVKGVNGAWSSFINLGETINTEEFEMSPFLCNDNTTLYFSSKGHDGHGDADVYRSTRLDESWTNWSEPVNLGPEINSSAFDAYFSITPDSLVYFASNRNSKMADIYSSKLLPAEKEEETIVLAETEEEKENLESVVEIDRNTYEEKKNNTQPMDIEQLYFDFDKFFLRDLSIKYLDAVVVQLLKEENSSIEIFGHTDNIGSPDYNIVLSKKRALAAKEYLMQQGVSPDRISTYWVGETDPLVENDTPQNRQKNRRVELFFN